MNPIDNYRQSDFADSLVKDRQALRSGLILAVLTVAVIAVDFYLLASLL